MHLFCLSFPESRAFYSIKNHRPRLPCVETEQGGVKTVSALESDVTGSYHILAMGLWVGSLTSLSLNFSICKMELKLAPHSQKLL